LKILLIKIAALGDILATTPFFHLIKEKYPDSKVDHLVLRGFDHITLSNNFLDEQILIDKLSLFNFIKLFFKLKSRRYEYVFIFHRSFLFQLLCYFSNIKYIYGFKSKFNIFLTKSLQYKIDVNRTLQEAALLDLSGLAVRQPTNLEYYINEKNIFNTEVIAALPKIYIVCGVGGGNRFSSAKNRLWPSSYYSELISKINIPFVLLGEGDSDKFLADDVEHHSLGNIINLAGKTNFDEAAKIIKNSILYIGNDSSLLYLAAAVGVKTLGLFGPTSAVAANPLGKNQFYLTGMSHCSPCYNPYHGNNGAMYHCKNNICMKNLAVEEVVRFINNFCLNHL
jgi:ADP-heptose:LPS heptosyltransferase